MRIRKMIVINCTGSDTVDIDQLTEFQGGLKERSAGDVEKIIKSIKKHGFSFPFFVWKNDGKNNVLDGHGRLMALQQMAAAGEEIPALPCVYISAKNEAEAKQDDPQRMTIHTTFLDIPRKWLGDAILHDMEQTKRTNKRAYENIYLGIATGTGRNIFENITLREITDDEIGKFDYFYNGVDFGYYPDPFAFVAMSYNEKEARLYIFDELYLLKHGNFEAYNALKKHMEAQGQDIGRDRITADSAEPKSIADFRNFGADMRGAIKGRGSLEAGFKWLQSLHEIVIDPARAPHAADEFTLYEYEIDKRTGEIITGYPQGQPDHALAAVRYALEEVWRHGGA